MSELQGVVLESRPFGRSEVPSFWVEAQAIVQVARFLKEDLEFQMDFLENLSLVELEDVLVATYFLRSTVTGSQLVLRISSTPITPGAEVRFASVRELWPMATLFESSVEELFGVRFLPLVSKDLQSSVKTQSSESTKHRDHNSGLGVTFSPSWEGKKGTGASEGVALPVFPMRRAFIPGRTESTRRKGTP